MEFLSDLWLPIVLSAVFVFVASSILHMVIPVHKGDFKKLPGEDAVMDALRGTPQGSYVFPSPSSQKDMGTPEMLAKYEKGAVGFVTVLPNGLPAIGKSLMQWFLFSLLAGVFVAYVGDLALLPGTEYRPVFRVTSTLAFMCYGLGYFMDPIWKGQSWMVSIKYMIDSLVYALVTGGTFGWLWPEGAM